MKKQIIIGALATALMGTTAFAENIKVGFVTTLTTPAAVIGNDQKNAVDLAMEHLGGKLGGKPAEIVF